mgnify:FL=1
MRTVTTIIKVSMRMLIGFKPDKIQQHNIFSRCCNNSCGSNNNSKLHSRLNLLPNRIFHPLHLDPRDVILPMIRRRRFTKLSYCVMKLIRMEKL